MSRFSSNSEASPSELLENIEKISFSTTWIVMLQASPNLKPRTGVLPVAKG